MGTEELRMLLDTLKQLGVEGKEAFIWWLIFDKALPVFGWLCSLSVSLWFGRGIVRQCVGRDAVGERVRDIFEIGRHGPMTRDEASATIRMATALVNRGKQNETPTR